MAVVAVKKTPRILEHCTDRQTRRVREQRDWFFRESMCARPSDCNLASNLIFSIISPPHWIKQHALKELRTYQMPNYRWLNRQYTTLALNMHVTNRHYSISY
jgi:hypothetical protein